MKMYTAEEIAQLDKSLEMMKQGHKEVRLEDLTQANLDELKELYDLIVGEFINATEGKNYDGVIIPPIEKLTASELESILNTLENASFGLVVIAKSRRI